MAFASLNKITFYSDYSNSVSLDNIQLFLEKEACATIGKLKRTSYFHKGIIKRMISDINGSEGIIYFEVILSSKVNRSSLAEVVSCLNKLLISA